MFVVEATIIVISILFYFLFPAVFPPLQDKDFETDEKIFCRVDELITLFYNTVHRLVWWVDNSSKYNLLYLLPFFWRKLQLTFLFFVHYRVTQVRYFSWNYFVKNFSLLKGLFRLVCLLILFSYFIIIINLQM